MYCVRPLFGTTLAKQKGFAELWQTRVQNLYQLAAMPGKDTPNIVFPKIDLVGNIRTGKVMYYNHDGHRDKNRHPRWLHEVLKELLPPEWELMQRGVSFGEHLLTLFPDKTVCYVEAEKTAVVCSLLWPNYLWLASGGEGFLNEDTVQVLTRRIVYFLPDAHSNWPDKLKQYAHKFNVGGVNWKLINPEAYMPETLVQSKGDVADVVRMYAACRNGIVPAELPADVCESLVYMQHTITETLQYAHKIQDLKPYKEDELFRCWA